MWIIIISIIELFIDSEQLQSLEIAKLSISDDIAKFYATVLLLLTVKARLSLIICNVRIHIV